MKKSGFTLLEMLAVLALSSIVFLGSLQIVNRLEDLRLRRIAEEIVDSLEVMQHSASSQNKNYYCYIKEVEGQYAFQIIKEHDLETSILIPRNIEISMNQEKTYFKRDLSPIDAGTITLRPKSAEKHIEIRMRPVTGKIKTYTIKSK